MKKIFYLTALVVLVFASCTKPRNDHNGERKYSLSIGASKEGDTNNASGTRLEMINGALHWSVGDRVGMFVGEYMYNGDLLLDDFAMDGQHTDPVKSTTFKGELTYDQISQFYQHGAYSFTSYHPYDMWVDFTHNDGHLQDRLHFEIPRDMELTPNEFPSQYAFMYARNTGYPPITWLDENDEQQWYHGGAAFYYAHALSYMRLKITNNPTNSPVVSIGMNSEFGNVNLSDTYELDPVFGDIQSYGGHSANRTRQIYIPDGLDVGDELYIPMIPSHYTADITFYFYFEDGTYREKLVPASARALGLERGTIHPITFTFTYPIENDSYELQDYTEGQDLGSY